MRLSPEVSPIKRGYQVGENCSRDVKFCLRETVTGESVCQSLLAEFTSIFVSSSSRENVCKNGLPGRENGVM